MEDFGPTVVLRLTKFLGGEMLNLLDLRLDMVTNWMQRWITMILANFNWDGKFWEVDYNNKFVEYSFRKGWACKFGAIVGH